MQLKGPIINDHTSEVLTKLLDMSKQRQRVIAQNMANANTPGFIRREVTFQEELARLVKAGDYEQLTELKGKITKDFSEASRLDGNNIKIPKEMNEMVQNSVFFNMAARALNTKMKILRDAISK